jgi:nitrate reductase gamma subunit
MTILIGIILPYIALVVLVAGLAWRTYKWATAPRHLPWGLYPSPTGAVGQGWYIAREVITLRSLLPFNKRIWLGGYAFHGGIALTMLWLVLTLLGLRQDWVAVIGLLAMLAMLGGGLYLFIARLVLPDLRAISTFVEYFNLALFTALSVLALAAIGAGQIALDETRAYLLGLATLNPHAPPDRPLFLLILLLAEWLMVYFPFSKMPHMISKYFSHHAVKWAH